MRTAEPLELEHAAWQAAAAGRAAEFYAGVMASNARVFLVDKQFTRAAALADWAPGLTYRRFRLSGETVLPVTGSLTYVTYQAIVQGGRVHCSTLYVRHGGRWLLTLHQRRPLPATEEPPA
ncbi:DUF4440 domain-containing protein [Amycolatopsis sp.]|uniref:DUF4440 domain-containing protein n=1 Tax=Amycolatopsis sp. TaxID=37632 RepID=UPI002C54B085|nr:DUF4440 domain-containing protein [Amycolatopsis sp.]HVV14588.1 DUF4440 domain-containing protein [Amycolatopsis sp.]